MNGNIILGINYGGHDTSAALMRDGALLAACEEERFQGEKHTRAFPARAIEACLKIAGVTGDDVGCIAVGYDPDEYHRNKARVAVRRSLPTRDDFAREIAQKSGLAAPVTFHVHHLCHVASAYYPSGFSDAVLVSNDGIGETRCSLIATGTNGRIDTLHDGNPWPHSLGLLYAAVTFYLGWKPNYDEGIVMGLAPYGDDTARLDGTRMTYRDVFEDIIGETGDFSYAINTDWIAFHEKRDTWISDKFVSVFGAPRTPGGPLNDSHKHVAAALQHRLETIVLAQLKRARTQTGLGYLCMAGGVGLNCSLNGRIEASGMFEEIFVPPASGDSGVAIGACYLASREHRALEPRRAVNFNLGSRFEPADIAATLTLREARYERPDNIYAATARALNDGRIVGWFQGGSEFGPRALGNRSILTAPYPGSMKDHVNTRVKFREPFRPFAPAVLLERARDYFTIRQESPHMLIACAVRDERVHDIPAVTHVDRSARVQTVTRDTNEPLYELLLAFESLTGCPVLLNTSFNVKGQPIVDSPEQAYDCFQTTNIDVLVLGEVMLSKEPLRRFVE